MDCPSPILTVDVGSMTQMEQFLTSGLATTWKESAWKKNKHPSYLNRTGGGVSQMRSTVHLKKSGRKTSSNSTIAKTVDTERWTLDDIDNGHLQVM